MTARVLVVDDVPANVRLLEARLSAEYFDVVTAMSGRDPTWTGSKFAAVSRAIRPPIIFRW
jgi:CheY-like chemotaxis protein